METATMEENADGDEEAFQQQHQHAGVGIRKRMLRFWRQKMRHFGPSLLLSSSTTTITPSSPPALSHTNPIANNNSSSSAASASSSPTSTSIISSSLLAQEEEQEEEAADQRERRRRRRSNGGGISAPRVVLKLQQQQQGEEEANLLLLVVEKGKEEEEQKEEAELAELAGEATTKSCGSSGSRRRRRRQTATKAGEGGGGKAAAIPLQEMGQKVAAMAPTTTLPMVQIGHCPQEEVVLPSNHHNHPHHHHQTTTPRSMPSISSIPPSANNNNNNNKQQQQSHHQPRREPPTLFPASNCKPVVALSRTQILLALLLFLSTLLASVLITFLLTRDAFGRGGGATELALAATDGPKPEAAKLVGRVIVGGQEDRDANDIARHRVPGKSLVAGTAPPPAPSKFSLNSTQAEKETVIGQEVGELAEAKKLLGGKQHDQQPGAEELRLSGELWPIWYNLSLCVYVPGFGAQIPAERNLSFDGDLLLKFRVIRNTQRVELNALKLQFERNNLSEYQLNRVSESGNIQQQQGTTHQNASSTPKVIEIRVDELREKVFFELDSILEQDAYFVFRIPYSGPIASKLSGLYLTTYKSIDGKQKCAAVTQMEPTDARRMIPSFDEPQFKAVYRLSIVHPIGSKAVSNAKELQEGIPTNENDWLRTDFDETLPMSSYLLALVVSDFQFVEGHTRRGTRFRIWARNDAVNLTSYALRAGIRVLEFYEDYYGIEFPLPKQDMMAFPDFAAGAMENWGLVTYREKYLLYSPHLYTAQQKMAVASVVAHELAHQWFGNLVTMRWWSDLWLNEGFATLMEYLGTDAISNGGFHMGDYFLVEALDSAFDRDSRLTSHPLFFEIRKAEDVSEAFDSITYSKGASVLRMIQAVMGEQSFKQGLNIYLNRFKYQNAEHTDLWDALTEAVPAGMHDWQGKPFSVRHFARRWTEQTGYPVVQVLRISPDRVMLTQQRFLLDHVGETQNGTCAILNCHQNSVAGEAAGEKLSWEIPIWGSINGTEMPMEWLFDTRELHTGPGDVLVLNSHSKGFYRVQYGEEDLHRIRQLLLQNHQKLPMASRVRIIDDTFTLAEGGYISYEEALNLTRYLAQEKEYPPWEMALTGFTTIQNYFEDEPEAGDMRAYIKSIIGTLFEQELGHIADWKAEEEEKRFFDDLLRQRIIQRMCTLRDSRCIRAILEIYKNKFIQQCQSLPSDETLIHNDILSTLIPKKQNPKMASQCSQVPVPFRTLAYCEGVHYGMEADWDLMLELFQRETVQVEKERLLVALACSRDTYILKKLLAMASDVNSTVIRLQDKPSVFTHVGGRIIGRKIVLDFFIDHWKRIYHDFKDQQTLLRSIISSAIVGKSQRAIDQMREFLDTNRESTKNLDVFKQRLEVLQTNTRWMHRNFAKLAQWFKEHNGREQGD